MGWKTDSVRLTLTVSQAAWPDKTGTESVEAANVTHTAAVAHAHTGHAVLVHTPSVLTAPCGPCPRP